MNVSIHAPARGATAIACAALLLFLFQSTRPHGARRALGWCRTLSACFNPRARTGRDPERCEPVWHAHVSIHAPARGATPRAASGRSDVPVSIHAPARGATRVRPAAVWARSSFNPRARTGRDFRRNHAAPCAARFQSTRPHGARRDALAHALVVREVSIHAPARGATVNICRNITLRIASMQVIHHERLECAPVAQYTSKKMREPPGTTPSLGVRANTQCVK